eukprot:364459-Chlamydomonas_euryale.AAC.7
MYHDHCRRPVSAAAAATFSASTAGLPSYEMIPDVSWASSGVSSQVHIPQDSAERHSYRCCCSALSVCTSTNAFMP